MVKNWHLETLLATYGDFAGRVVWATKPRQHDLRSAVGAEESGKGNLNSYRECGIIARNKSKERAYYASKN